MVGKTKLTVRGKSPDDGIHRKKVWKGVDLHDRRSVVLLGFRCSEIMSRDQEKVALSGTSCRMLCPHISGSSSSLNAKYKKTIAE